MRTALVRWCLALVLALAWLTEATAQTWQDFQPEGGKYRILMPGTPKVTTKPITLSEGSTVAAHFATYETDDTAYGVIYCDYPASFTRGKTADTILDNAMKASVGNRVLLNETRLTIQGHPAREFAVDRLDGYTHVVRIAFVGSRLYALNVAGRHDVEKDAATRRFLESFSLMDQ